jgi:hypothetical protein
MDTREFLVALRMSIVFIESLQHVWEANDSSSTFFLSTCGDDREILVTIPYECCIAHFAIDIKFGCNGV